MQPEFYNTINKKIIYSAEGGRVISSSHPVLSSTTESIPPSVDFYSYVNYKWQKHIHLPPYEDSFGVSEEIELSVRNNLFAAIEKQRKEYPHDPISKLATSFLHTSTQKSSVLDLQKVLNTFDCIKTPVGLAETIGYLNKIQCAAPLVIVVNNDYYDSAKCCIYLYEPTLGLPSKHYYVQNGVTGTRNRILLKYSKLLQSLGNLMNIESLESAISTEAHIIPFLSEEQTQDNYTLHQLEHTFKHVPWRTMFESWGLAIKHIEDVQYVVTNKKYMDKFNNMFETTSIDVWRTWMRAITATHFVKYLPPPFDDLHSELYDRMLKGVVEKLPQKNLTLQVLMNYTPQDLSHIFVDLYVKKGTKKYATKLIHDIQEATIKKIQGLSWMENTTKHTALKKVRLMKFQIAYPETWTSETEHVEIDVKRPLHNILNLASYDTRKMIQNLEKDDCKKKENIWTDGAFEVNAFYYPENNMIVVPAGILRPPFFDMERSHAWNLGGIGAVIGHEITHAFDNDGRLFDETGNYKNWWTTDDEKTFETMTKNVIEMYDGFSYMGGKVNGRLTLAENLSDLGGVSIALKALNMKLEYDNANATQRKKAYIDFFTSYAVSWRQKDRPKKAKQALLLDVHAPPLLRVNLVVKQFSEFYEAFDITEKDAGYIAPEMRITFW
jgi:putative endopeptidase